MKSHNVAFVLMSSPPTASSFLIFALGLELPSLKDSLLFHPTGDLKTIFGQKSKGVNVKVSEKEVSFGVESRLLLTTISTEIFTILIKKKKKRHTLAEKESSTRPHHVIMTNEEQETEQENLHKQLAQNKNQSTDPLKVSAVT